MAVATVARGQQVITSFSTESGATIYELGAIAGDTLGRASLKVGYEHRWKRRPTTDPDRFTEDFVILELGGGRSKFYSEKTRQVDSLVAASTPDRILADPGAFKGGLPYTVFCDAATGRITYIEKVMRTWYLYEEPLAEIAWTIGDRTREVAGYACTMATGRFRGRDWTVWFARELAVDAGPWKLRGLPGLILAASSDDGEFFFEAVEIRRCDEPIVRPIRKYLETDYPKFRKLQYRAMSDPIGFLKNTAGISMTVRDERGNELDPASMKKEYNQIEKE